MNPFIKGAIAFGTMASTGGAIYGAYSFFNSDQEKLTYAKELIGTLLSTNANEDQDKWNLRLESLKSSQESSLVTELNTLKKKDSVATWAELKNWCKNNISKVAKTKEDKEFQNIQNYCTFSVKEKLSNVIVEVSDGNDNEWAVGHAALKLILDNELVEELRTVKTQTNGTANASVKSWCNKIFLIPYKGEKDIVFKNASKICVTKPS